MSLRIGGWRGALLFAASGAVLTILLQSLSNLAFFPRELVYLSSPYLDVKGLAKACLFFVTYLFCAVALIPIALQRSRLIAFILIAYLLVAVMIDTFIQLIGSPAGFTSFQYLVAVNEMGNARNLMIFRSQAIYALLITAAVGLLIFVGRRFCAFRAGKLQLLMLPLCLGGAVAAKAAVYYISTASYPAFVKIPLIIGKYHLEVEEQKPRVLAANVQATLNRRKNILFVIDESIGGSYLSVNGYALKTTPDLERLVSGGVIENFGVVPSVANCSAASNLLMRIGLSPLTAGADSDFVRQRKELPTIFQYAKRAGYKTWLFDSQNRADKGALQNYMTYDDLKYVDKFSSHASRTKESERDFLALQQILDVVGPEGSEGNFVVLVKDGAHWPYLWRFPAEKAIFLPTQASEYEPMVPANKVKIKNTYSNLIRHTTNDFLTSYVNYGVKSDTVLFYTSDHGQALVEPDAKDGLTHCSAFHDPHNSQAEVPLMVIESGKSKRYHRLTSEHYFQSQIFPSLLEEMGYEGGVTGRYGRSLVSGYPTDFAYRFYWSINGDSSPYKWK